MLHRRFAVLLLAAAAVAAGAGACGDDPLVRPAELDAAAPAVVGEGICPQAAPTPSEACVLPEGTTCSFGACATTIAKCVRGLWLYGGNPPPRPPCPDPEPPAPQSACPPCWPAGLTCQYGSQDCSAPGASANRTVASCPNGQWILAFSPCGRLDAAPPAPPEEPPSDAGADVQGDAGPDAD